MTVREWLRKRRLWSRLLYTAAFALPVGVGLLLEKGPGLERNWPWMLAALAGMCFAAVMEGRWVACPRCGYELARLPLRPRTKLQVNLCPHCALKLDAAWSEAEQRA